MRRVTLTLLIFLFVWQVQAQHPSIHFKNKTFKHALSAPNPFHRNLQISFPEIAFIPVETPQSTYCQLSIPGTYRSGKAGEPQLLSFQKIMAVPFDAEINWNISNFETRVYALDEWTNQKKIIPFQESTSKNAEPADTDFRIDASAYAKNSFSKQAMVTITELGVLRGLRLVKVTVNPLQYNPGANKLKVFNQIELDISFRNANFSKTKQQLESTLSPFFAPLYEQFIPAATYESNPDLIQYPVRYLLITPGNYLPTLYKFISWKTQKGFDVVVGNTDSIGFTAAEITQWIQQQYTDTLGGIPAPSFVLLVGDVAQIPASKAGVATNRATDLYYASIDGDMLPEMYYGRLPAQDTMQLKGMLDKILMYEKYQFPDDSFLDQVTLIAGADPTFNVRVAQPTVKYGTENYFNAMRGFSTVNAYLSSYTGCYTTDKIGVSLINYTAHCSQTSWANPYLTVSTVSSYTNVGKYPVAIGNCCTSGDFSINTCIGEAFVRNPNGGAIGYLGSVPDTFWWEDFYWAVGAHNPVFNQYPSPDSSSIGMFDAPFTSGYQCLDALLFAGNLAVTEAHNLQYEGDVSSLYYWEAYHCLGDPSLVPYFTRGLNPLVTHNERLESGLGEFLIHAEPGALVTLSVDDQILDTKQTDNNGSAVLNYSKNLSADSVQLVVTCPKYKPYLKTLPVTVSQSSYLALKTFLLTDSLGNLNTLADFGELLRLDLQLENIGDSLSQNIKISLTENSPFISLSNTSANLTGAMLLNQQAFSVSGSFYLQIADSVPDQEVVSIGILLSDSVPGNERKYYEYQRNLILQAPELKILPALVFDDFASNGNELPDMGELLDVKVGFINSGHAAVSSTLMPESLLLNSHFTFLNPSFSSFLCLPNDTIWTSFAVQMDENPMLYPKDTLRITLGNGTYYTERIFPVHIGGDTLQEFGQASHELSDYPFNNYFKNNKTQLLFKSSELSAGIKALNKIAFNFSQVTPNVIYRDLTQLKIYLKPTGLNALDAFEPFTNESLVFDSALFYLPANTGWFTIDLEKPFIPEQGQNLLMQISWGPNDNYPDIADRTKVFGSLTDFNSVAYGFDDAQNPPLLYAKNNLRPDVQFIYDSVSILNILVQGDLPIDSSLTVCNAQLLVNGQLLFTDVWGKTKYIATAFSEMLDFSAKAYGYRDTLFSFQKVDTSRHLELNLTRNPKSIVRIIDSWDQALADVTLVLNGYSFTTNAAGLVESYALAAGQTAHILGSKTSYLSIDTTLAIYLPGDTLTIQMPYDWADLSLQLLNSKEQALANVHVFIDGHEYKSNALGQVQIANLVPGSHGVFIFHPDYLPVHDTLLMGVVDSTYTLYLKSVGKVLVSVKDENQIPVTEVKVQLGTQSKITDSWGFVQFNQVTEGTYSIQIFDTAYYTYSDSLQVFGTSTSRNIELQSKPSLSLYFYDGFAALDSVEVSLGSIVRQSNSDGRVIFQYIDTGWVHLEIKKAGYFSTALDLFVNGEIPVYNVHLQALPDLTFAISDSSGPVANLPVQLDSLSVLSNNQGQAVFKGIMPGIHAYQIQKEGFYSVNAQILLDSVTTVKSVFLHEIPDINWKLYYKNNPVDSARISFNGQNYITDAFGEYSLQNIEAGTYTYTVSKQGYETLDGTLTVTNKNINVYLTLPKLARLTFYVESNNQPMADAQLLIDTFAVTTDSEGYAVIEAIAQGTHLYSIYKPGFFELIDTLFLDSDVYTENIIMFPEVYSATFTINNGHDFLSGVKLWLDTTLAVTNTQGQALFFNLKPGQSYHYQVIHDGYLPDTGTIIIAHEDLLKEITLELISYNVLFKVFDTNGPLALATLSFDNKIKTSNTQGEALFSGVVPADSLPYIVKKATTHWADTGWVKLSSDTTLHVLLIAIGVDEDLAKAILVYPNPSEGKVFVHLPNPEQNFDCSVFNSQGMLVFNLEHCMGSAPIDLSAFGAGVYYLHLSSGEQFAIKPIVLKK